MMYCERPALTKSTELYQGDLVQGMLRPVPINDKSIMFRDRGNIRQATDAELSDQWSDNIRVQGTTSELAVALVVSNSCDNENSGYPLVFAPARDFAPTKGWPQVSQAATSAARLFYLPSHDSGLFKRSQAILSEFFAVEHSLVGRLIRIGKVSRLCGMSDEGQRHLQWTIAAFFGRHPREDMDWPSIEDLEMKIAHIEVELPTAYEGDRARLTAQVDAAKAELARRQKTGAG